LNNPEEDNMAEPKQTTIIDYGPDVRMDRIDRQAMDGTYYWGVYKRKTITDSTNPVTGKPTTETEIWIPHSQGNESDCRQVCEQLSGVTVP